jgi:MoaA/NifB/PqqE/SkfB family radical SAM enzyme
MPDGYAHFEIQLGHLCNDRCVFCASGQATARGQAPLLEPEPIARSIREARERGSKRIIFVGGEPTIQPMFLDMVKLAVDVGFERIVIFSNGSKTGRTELIDDVIATGGDFEWRFSVHGATRDAHERTTQRKGSFDQICKSLARAHARGQRITINMCVVTQNYESLGGLGALLTPYDVKQVHVDMLNPYDVAPMPEAELHAMMVRYSELAAPLEAMVRGFADGFDVNIGSLPYCVAPRLAPWIHHGGAPTWTVTADDSGGRGVQRGRSLFVVKSEKKWKPESCRACVFDERCSGVFGRYAERWGVGELVPVERAALAAIDPERQWLAVHARPWLRDALDGVAPWAARVTVEEPGLRVVRVTFVAGDGAQLRVELTASEGDRTAASQWFAATGAAGANGDAAAARRRRDWAGDAIAAGEWFGVRVLENGVAPELARAAVAALWARLEAHGVATVHPPGEDAFAALDVTVRDRLRRLRVHAPFGALRWTATRVLDGGARVEIDLAAPPDASAATATVWLALRDGRPFSGYRVEPREPPPAIVEGVRAVLDALGYRTSL